MSDRLILTSASTVDFLVDHKALHFIEWVDNGARALFRMELGATSELIEIPATTLKVSRVAPEKIR